MARLDGCFSAYRTCQKPVDRVDPEAEQDTRIHSSSAVQAIFP
jgi:hypothetical protein